MRVNILMSTYNGEPFLADQIESIRRQTFKDWKLLIRDDGSTDRTRSIIKVYTQKDDRIFFINEEDFQNCGVIESFYRLVKFEEADYYFFSDQDDVWLEDKLEVQLAAFAEHDSHQPIMVYMDLMVVDAKLNVLHRSMVKTQSHHANTKLYQEMTENTVTGGVSGINHSLASLWTRTDNVIMHDWYLALLAAALGQLIYIDKPGELYRQHGNNVLGARTWDKRIKNWLQPQALVAKYWYLITSSQKQASLLRNFELTSSDRDLVDAFVGITEAPLMKRLSSLKSYKLAKNRWFHTFIFRTLIITKFGYRRN
ncbi:glycosyltransferase family 2 protein [Streptococcus sciuri]|uniref:Glycosyltransferase family 2 protein n=1 Tax=Streptococcus sciuri TaxID=2973939 RepID=A0ABT2F6E7_9STRE|nr:glycosyltransferase family 2 protein [Streptococcus sciuri]MCS4488046.1 glycosyltransferase family 2 protein [Streptococcus sciuri]